MGSGRGCRCPHRGAGAPAALARADAGARAWPHARIESRAQKMLRAFVTIPRGLRARFGRADSCRARRLRGQASRRPIWSTARRSSSRNAARATRWPTPGRSGTVGPNLDDAFRQDRADGVKSTSIQGLIDYWIQYPNTQGVMPASSSRARHAQDVAAYVAHVAALPGQDAGALAPRCRPSAQKPATEKNGAIQIDADPNGQLKFLASSASGSAGQGHGADAEQVLGASRHRDPRRRRQRRRSRSSPTVARRPSANRSSRARTRSTARSTATRPPA